MRSVIIIICLLLATVSYAQDVASQPEVIFEYQHEIVVEISSSPVNIKTFLPNNYSEGRADFSTPVVYGKMTSTMISFMANDYPVVVIGPATMTLRWVD